MATVTARWQTRLLETTETYSFMVLQARILEISANGLKSNCQQGHTLRKESITYMFQLLMTTSIPWFVATSLQFSKAASSTLSAPSSSDLLLCMCQIFLCFLLVRILEIAFRVYVDNNIISPQNPYIIS